MPLHHVDPHRQHGRVYRAFVQFGRSRPGQAWGRHVGPRVDPALFRLTRGHYPFWGMRMAPLISTGAKSGQPRQSQLTYFHDGDDVILIASNYGGPRNPAWFHNLLATPECSFGDRAFVATQVTDPAEYERLYALAEHVYAGYGDYRVKTAAVGRQIPLFRLTPRSN